MTKFDAIVLGGGPGGYECAIRLSQNGLKTALVEEAELGGTCLNRGCIPTKSLLHAAELYHTAKGSSDFGVDIGDVSFNYEKIIERKDAVAKQLSNGVGFLQKNHGVTVFNARGTLLETQKIELSTGETLECTHTILATGSLPANIPIPGIDLPGVVDSTALLDMKTCPEHIVIVGGGVIGVEFATFFNRLDVKVTIIEMLDRILEPMDQDVSKIITAELTNRGIDIHVGVKVDAIEPGLKVNYSSVDGSVSGYVEGDTVLIAGGRVPNTQNIGLEKVGVHMNKKGFVEVDGLCRTNVPGVFAIGDMNGEMLLAHVASGQGLAVADFIAGKPAKQLNLNHIPSCVYCSPEIAMVGLTEEKAKVTGRDVGTGMFNLSGNGRAMTMGENSGFFKLVYDKATEEILGCHMVGPYATELIAEIVAVMECEGTITELGKAVHPHPTVSEAIMEAAHACHGNSVNAPKPRK
ncbi:MAG TPA: dihydrolipoyl dehydrogenase [Clostridiaceae bacterium]|nr:dihydrolipoyl dehydrogenase [Clostridiaceae bacterium]